MGKGFNRLGSRLKRRTTYPPCLLIYTVGRSGANVDNGNKKTPNREQFQRETFNQMLPEEGVVTPGELAGGHWCLFNGMERHKERHGDRAEKLAMDSLNAIMDKITEKAATISNHGIPPSDTYAEYALRAKPLILEAIEHDRPAQAALFALLMAANSLASGEQLYAWALQDLAKYERNEFFSSKSRVKNNEGKFKDNDPALIICQTYFKYANETGDKNPTQSGLSHWLDNTQGDNFKTVSGLWASLEFEAEGSTGKDGKFYPTVYVREKARGKEKKIGWSTLLKRWSQAKRK